MKKFFKKPYFIFAALIAVFLTCFAIHSEVSASALKVKDGQKLCGTFTFNVSKSSDGVKKQDFQVCGIVDKKKNFKSSLELRNGNWNNSIAYVSINGNILNIYDSPMNQGAIIGSLGAVYIGDQKQFIPTVGQNFETYLKSIKTYLNSLKDRKYWHKISNTDSVSSKATFKNQIDWSKEDVTADDANLVANNKAKCEAKGYTWKGNDAEGYECVDADGNVADASLSIAGSSTGSTGSGGGNACYANSTGIGWILCPAVSIATEAVQQIYNMIEEDFLKIKVENLFDDSNGVLKAWEAFRDIANIVFIILLIVVILSQLTGFGIDNYGIKKILPKLIVVAVLINLSYIICQLAVDVSNIIGVSLRGFLDGIVGVDPSNPTQLGTNPDGIAWALTIGGLAIAIGAIVTNPGLLLSLAVAVVGMLVAIFFLWIVLVVREAGVVIAIVIAPVAIACYLLPNTERLTKRWVDLFKALLLLYPICSIVVGGGELAGHILAQVNSEPMHLAAMLVQVIPYFFIPTLLKKSLDGMGALGSKISGLGRVAQGKTTGAMRGSDAYKAAQQRGLQRKTRIKAGLDKNGNLTRVGNLKANVAKSKFGGAIGYGRTQKSRINAAQKAIAEDTAGAAAFTKLQTDRAVMQGEGGPEAQYEEALTKALSGSGNKQQALAVLSAISQSGMTGSQKNNVLRNVMEGADFMKDAKPETRIDTLRSMAQTAPDLMASDPELMQWASRGGVDSTGRSVGLGGFATQIDRGTGRQMMSTGDIDDKDLDSITASRLQDLMANNIINQEQAKRHLANGGGKSDIEKIMFGAYAHDGVALTKDQASEVLGGTNLHGYSLDQRDRWLERPVQEVMIRAHPPHP